MNGDLRPSKHRRCPLRSPILAALALCTLALPGAARAYLSPEHKKIGDAAAGKALPALHAADGQELVRPDAVLVRKGVWASFGDLVALYGDYRETVDDLLSTAPARLRELQRFVLDFSVLKHAPALLREV